MSTIDESLSREHHVRRRAEQVRADLEALWGDDLPPGPDPRTTELVDALALDDDHGRTAGLLVQGDAIPFHLLVRLLATSSVGEAVLTELPPELRARVDLAVATVDPLAMAAWAATRGLPQTPSGAFAMHVDPPVIDLDERVSGLLGFPARQHRLPWAESMRNVHPADVGLVADATRHAFEKQASLSMRFRVLHEDGSVLWVSTVGHALAGEDGGTEQVVGFTMPSP
ncbi:PAS domain-containing protein [Kineococcus sp. NBC_00420]|uniref:PAS domain-containing protein n=1 Tax=unclassified Kineococcus TaxID=2621656 RepID=UPI002E239DDE